MLAELTRLAKQGARLPECTVSIVLLVMAQMADRRRKKASTTTHEIFQTLNGKTMLAMNDSSIRS